MQLRKILEDTSSSSSDNGGYSKGGMPLASAELMQLQEACTRCTRDLEEVRGGSSKQRQQQKQQQDMYKFHCLLLNMPQY